MTAVSKKVQKFTENKNKLLKNTDAAGVIISLFLAVSRAQAVWADVPVAFLAFVLIAACKDVFYKSVMAAGAVAVFAVMTLGDIFYLPYMLGGIVYITGWSITGKEKYRLGGNMAVFFLAKVVLFCLSRSFRYSLYTVMECCRVWRLSGILASADDVPGSSDVLSFADTVTLLLTGLTLTVVLSAFDSMWLYTGTACALAVAWLYSRQGQFFYSILGLVCTFVSMLDKNEFSLLFICGAAVWLAGAVFSEKTSVLIYPATALTALGMNLAFLPQLKGFAITGTALGALVVYTVLPRLMKFPQMKKPEFFCREKDYRQLMLGVKKLESSLNYLGSCAIDISGLNEKNLTGRTLEDMVAEDVCKNCEKSSHCWQEKYSYTAQQFAKYAKSMNWAEEKGFEMGFYSQCICIEKVKKSFEENSRLLMSRRYTMQSQKNNQKLLQTAFMSIAAAIGDLAHHNRSSRLVNSTITMQTSRLLDSMDIAHSYCLCSQNPDKATFAVTSPLPESRLYKIKLKLEQLYGEKFSDGEYENQGNELIYSFYSRPLFTYDYRVESSAFRQVNGDGYTLLTVGNVLYVLLSDGMGTGAAAAAESRTVLEMTKSLLTAQTSVASAINIVNLAMNLRGSSESGASLDILSIDLYTGKAALTKAGAGVTAVVGSDGSLNRYYKDSLPLGVVKDTKTATEEFVLKKGDTVIMMSDGVGNVSSNIKNLYDASCEEIAKFAINENKTLDDKTAIAIRIKILQ
ncbi:MAG: SpoIIE family protein phosphatase [Oscillospiraceae bacterium]|nr:SpoIIE family protein phosphatase [Oscillospiraceae bacterium]